MAKKMKNVLLMGLSFVLVAALAIGGTIAYLTDTDSDVNVMTLGNVKIEQFEMERVFDENGNVIGMQPYTQGQALMPAVVTNGSGNEAWAPNPGVDINYGDYIEGAQGGNGTWLNLNNEMDKFVFVKNTGKSDAFYRTIIAYEAETTVKMKNDYNQDMIHFNINGNNRFVWDDTVIENVEIDGVKYNVFSVLYTDVLKPGEISRPSLLQVGMDQIATNEYVAQFGDTYDILVLSQAVQTAGFDNAATALNTGFGEVNAENIAKWFGGMVTNAGATFSEPGEYEINKAIIFEDETGDNIVANKEGVVVNVNGGYYDTGSQRNNCAVWAYNGGVININDGTFIADGDAAPATSASHLDLIYAGQNGTINIYGGTFSLRNNNGWLLNEKDDTATITVYGGSFLNWNPADNVSEGANTNFVAEGYTVETETSAEGTWYHVVPVKE